jgi:hypothetical protein
MYTPYTTSILGMNVCAIQKYLFHFLFHFNAYLCGTEPHVVNELGVTVELRHNLIALGRGQGHFGGLDQQTTDLGSRRTVGAHGRVPRDFVVAVLREHPHQLWRQNIFICIFLFFYYFFLIVHWKMLQIQTKHI